MSARWLARAIGAPVAEVDLLGAAFVRDERRRRGLHPKGGLHANALDLILAKYFALAGLGFAVLPWLLAGVAPGVAALLLSTLHLLLLSSLLMGELHGVLLSDEGYRVIAAWPVHSASFFVARLRAPMRRALLVTLLLLTPSAFVFAMRAPRAVLPGVAFLAASLIASLLVTWAMAAFYALLLRLIGAARVRVLAVVLQVLGVVTPAVAGAMLQGRLPMLARLLAEPPVWFPAAWVAAPVELASGAAGATTTLRLIVGAAVTLLLPVVALRLGARVYTAGLASARSHGGRSRLLAPFSLLARRARDPSTRTVATLLVAHARGDWRFRTTALFVPCLALGLAGAALAGVNVRAAFADPLRHDTLMPPAMLFVWLALFLPLVAAPVMVRSSDHGAAWVLRASTLPVEGLELAARRILRLVFVWPLMLVTAGGYLLSGVGWISVLAHIVTIALMSELALRGAQRLVNGLPFSRAPDDEAVQHAVAALVSLAWAVGFLVAAIVVHLVYRHWIAIVVFDFYLLIVARGAGHQPARASQTVHVQADVLPARTGP